ncbi:MAG: hypothetical protein Q4B63_05680 [Clostridium perfringens]|nr:hypothetical protein [Clostridium perfringens]
MNLTDELRVFLESNDIVIADKKDENYNKTSIDKIVHIDNLVKIQKAILSYDKPYSLGLSSFIWKDIEMFKMWNRRGRKIIKDYNLKELEDIVNKGENSINTIYKIPYLNLIHRAMDNNEICVGKTSESNIWKSEKINVLDLSKMNFNLIEQDCYKYLFKFKKKGISLAYDKIVDHFIKRQSLSENSSIYINSLLSYPYESMKIIQREYLRETLNREEILKKSEILRDFYDESLI